MHDHGVDEGLEFDARVLLLDPGRGLVPFLRRRIEIDQIGDVLATGCVIGSCVQLEADLIESPSEVHRQRTKHLLARPLMKSSQQALLQLIGGSWVQLPEPSKNTSRIE